jgi:hypothetical protein
VAWALLAAAIVYTWPTRDTSRHHWLKALVVGLAVASHWFLDLIVHLPDLPLAGDDSARVGLGLWRSAGGTIAVELLAFVAGFALYFQWRRQKGRGHLGRVGIVAGLLVALYAASLLGPPPSSIKVVAIVDILGTLILAAMAAWSDRSTPKARP